jgi:hypothetical protein
MDYLLAEDLLHGDVAMLNFRSYDNHQYFVQLRTKGFV